MFTAPRILWNHPANRGHRAGMLARWFLWNVRKRVWPRPKIMPLFGYEFLAYPDCPVGHRINFFKDGLFEYDEMRFFLRFVGPRDVLIDVGAHVGAYTLLFHSLARQGRVISVEPTPKSFRRLAETIARNGLEGRTVLVNKAMGQAPGTVLFSTGTVSTHNRVTPSGSGGPGRVEVPCTTLDELAASLGLERADFVKIDTEGLEESVILGGRGFFERLRPRAVQFEANGLCLDYGSNLGQAFDLLRSADYRVGLYLHDANEIRLIRDPVPPVSPCDNYFAFSRAFLEQVGGEVRVTEVDGGAL